VGQVQQVQERLGLERALLELVQVAWLAQALRQGLVQGQPVPVRKLLAVVG